MLRHELNGDLDVWERIDRLRESRVTLLAPAVQQALARVLTGLIQTRAFSIRGLGSRYYEVSASPLVFETLRSDELQRIYYERGTTKASSAELSWHFYGLAADVIHPDYEWFGGPAARRTWPNAIERAVVGQRWFRQVALVAEAEGLAWGGRWTVPDLPHLQWGRCRASPEDAPTIYRSASGGEAGRRAVWRAVGGDLVDGGSE